METLDLLIDSVEKCLHKQLESGLHHTDTDEFGKVVDIYKDLVYIKSIKNSKLM